MKRLRMTGASLLGAIVLAAGLPACATLENALSIEAPGREPDELLRGVARWRGMNAAELVAESEALQKAWNNRRSEESRLRLALFLAVVPGPSGDRARALALLDVPPSEQNGRGRNHPLAQTLLPLLQENRRLDEALSASQQKLDALREIDTKMQERGKPR